MSFCFYVRVVKEVIMEREWNYASHSHYVSLKGGPEQYEKSLRKEGYDEGYLEGRNEGYLDGHNDGYQEGVVNQAQHDTKLVIGGLGFAAIAVVVGKSYCFLKDENNRNAIKQFFKDKKELVVNKFTKEKSSNDTEEYKTDNELIQE